MIFVLEHLRAIQDMIRLHCRNYVNSPLRFVKTSTVDAAQGGEASYVLLTFGKTDGKIGFLRNDYDHVMEEEVNGRLCTALTRARLGMIVYMVSQPYQDNICNIVENETLISLIQYLHSSVEVSIVRK